MSGKVGRQTNKAERELSNKQEKAKGKGQESRHQNRFPPLFYRALTFEFNRSRGFLRAPGNSKFKILCFVFQPEGFLFTFGKGGGAG